MVMVTYRVGMVNRICMIDSSIGMVKQWLAEVLSVLAGA